MTRFMQLFKGSALRTFLLLVNVLITFLLVPFILSHLGTDNYGIWILVSSLTGYYFLLDLGISPTVTRFVSRVIGSNRRDKITEIISNSTFIFSLISILTILLTLIIAYFIKFYVPPKMLLLYRTLIFIVGLEFALSLPLRVYEGILNAHLIYDVLSVFEVIKIFIRSFFIVIFLNLGHGLIAISVINLIANVSFFLACYLYTKHRFKDISINFKLVSKKQIYELIQFSKHIIFAQVGDLVRFRISSFIIAGFLGLTYVTFYSIPMKMIDYFIQVINRIFAVLNPLFSQYEGASDYKAMREKFILAVRTSTIASFFIGGNIIIFGSYFIYNWLGPEFKESSYLILVILTVSFTIALSQSISIGILQSVNKHKVYAWFNFSEAILNVIISFILVKPFGLIGVALGTAIPMILTKVFLQPYYVCKYLNLKLKEFWKSILPIILFMGTYFIIFWAAISHYFSTMSYYMMIIFGTIEVITLTLLIYAFILNMKEKGYINLVISKVTSILKNFAKATILLIPSKKRIIYIGWVGYNNLGDEILYLAHKKLFPEYSLYMRNESRIIDTIEKKVPWVKNSPVILGGGTLIYRSKPSLNILDNYKNQSKIFCIGTGVANPEFWQERIPTWNEDVKKWNNTLDSFRLKGVRGPISAKLLTSAKVKKVNIIGDTALYLAKNSYAKKKKSKTIGINFGVSGNNIWGSEKEVLEKFEKLIKHLLTKEYKVILMPVWDKDYQTNLETFNKLKNPNLTIVNYMNDFEKYYKTVEQCDIFVGEKLHAVVIACMTRTPSIMIEYRPKCRDFMASIDMLEYCVRADKFTVNNTLKLIEELYKNYDTIQKKLDNNIMTYKKRLSNFANLIKNEIRKKN